MHYWRKAALFAGTVLCLSASQVPRSLWQGESGGYVIQWSTANLRAQSGGKTILDMASSAKSEWMSWLHSIPPHSRYYETDYTYGLLSVVGPILSVKQEVYCNCAAPHATDDSSFRAINLSKSTVAKPNPAALMSWFSPDDVLKVLINEPIIRKAIPSDSRITSLQELVSAMKPTAAQLNNPDSCVLAFHLNDLQSFAFYDYDGQNVSVRINLFQYGVCDDHTVQIGIVLPAPASLRKNLEDAKAHRAGFLMKDRPVIGDNQETSIHFAEPHIKVLAQ